MRWALVVVCCLVAVLVGAFVVVPEAGGPQPGRLFDRTTTEECREQLAASKDVEMFERMTGESGPTRVSARWVWLSRGYGWGCEFEFPGGYTARTEARE